MKTRTFLAATCVSAALAAASNAQTITSTAYSQDDLADDGSTSGAFMTATTVAGKTIGGVATNVNVALSDNSSALDTMTLHVTGSGYDFFYDLSITAYQSEGGTETAVRKRYNNGRAMPDSGLAGQHRQRIDSPDTVGAGNWEFVRLTVGNVVNNGGTPVTLLGFNSIRLDSLNPGDNGNFEDVNNSGAVIDVWVGDALSFDQIIDLSDTYTASVDLVGTGNAGGNNANRPIGFAVDFQVGAGGGSDIKLTISPGSTSGVYDFSWSSQEDKVYDLVSSTDLTTTPDTWAVWEGQEGVEGTGSTLPLTDIPGGGDVTRFFAVVEKDPPPPPAVFSADFEADNGGFTVVDNSGGAGTPWEYGDPDSVGAGGSVTTGAEGSTNCWGVGIGNPGFYLTATDTSLVSPVIDLTSVPNALLSFAEAIDVLVGDTFVVNVIDPDISGGISVLDAAIHTSTPDGDLLAADWTTVSAIPIVGSRMIRLEWRFDGDNDGTYIGAYIDDVVVTEDPGE